jgi:hypothetical protein
VISTGMIKMNPLTTRLRRRVSKCMKDLPTRGTVGRRSAISVSSCLKVSLPTVPSAGSVEVNAQRWPMDLVASRVSRCWWPRGESNTGTRFRKSADDETSRWVCWPLRVER